MSGGLERGSRRMLAVVGLVVTVAGCSNVAPPGADPAPTRSLGTPIVMQIMRSQPPTQAGRCPAGTVALYGSDPNVPRVAAAPVHLKNRNGSSATPAPAPSSATRPAGVACYVRVGRPVTITSASVSSVTTRQNQAGPAWYEFAVVFPAADVPALTALIRQAYGSGDALGMSVAGKLWQAPQPRSRFNALRAEQINLLSKSQAFQLYRLLVPSG
jgi:hypothetical protein